jgi:drug/metabolite transporter (DMT)-like permease
VRTIAYTAAALVAFASNSVLCRMALGRSAIDAATFSTVRLAAGAAALVLIKTWTQKNAVAVKGSWTSAALLFLYAVPFSFAYIRLTAGTGALILFGSVQVTMMMAALRSGERPSWSQWSGLGLAVAGLVYLVLPGLAAPPLSGSLFMALAGASWGAYSLRGRGAANPLAQTTSNFVRAVPMAIVVSLAGVARFHAESTGVLLAVTSGALASGVGYVLWYSALRGLSAIRASVVQLIVPILAAAGGVVLIGESISVRLLLSATVVLGGIALALARRQPLRNLKYT